MITVLVQFKLPHVLDRNQAEAAFLNVSGTFHGVPGLIRKYFLISEDGETAGGAYMWESREDADRFYTDSFKRSIQEKYGSTPSINYFESPVIVDNLADETVTTW